MKKFLVGTLLFITILPKAFAQDFACNEPLQSPPSYHGALRSYLLSPEPLSPEKGLKSSQTYIHEVNAKDGRWKLIGTSMGLCASTYGLFLYPAFVDVPGLINGFKDKTATASTVVGGFCGYYIPAVLLSGAVPFLLTMDKPIKRGPPIAFGGFGVLGFMDGLWIFLVADINNLKNSPPKNQDDGIALGQNAFKTMVFSTVGSAVGGYFLAKKLELGPGEASMITANGRWMYLSTLLAMSAYLTRDQVPTGLDFATAGFILSGDVNFFSSLGVSIDKAQYSDSTTKQIRTDNALIQNQLKRGQHALNFVTYTPFALIAASVAGCTLGYYATRLQSFTQGDVRIYNNMIFMSELTTLALLASNNMYSNLQNIDKALAIQALAYPIGGLLDQFIFGRMDFSNNQSKLVGIETQLFCLIGAGIGGLTADKFHLGRGILIGGALGANAGFLTYFFGVKKYVERANFSMLRGTSDMGFTILPHDKGNLAPGLRLSYTF